MEYGLTTENRSANASEAVINATVDKERRTCDKECSMGTVTNCARSCTMAYNGKQMNTSVFRKDLCLVPLDTSPEMGKQLRRSLKGNNDEQQGSIEQSSELEGQERWSGNGYGGQSQMSGEHEQRNRTLSE